MPLRGDIFDFDGVIADTEPLHLRTYQLKCVTVIRGRGWRPRSRRNRRHGIDLFCDRRFNHFLPDVDDEKTKRGQARGIPRYPVVGPVPPQLPHQHPMLLGDRRMAVHVAPAIDGFQTAPDARLPRVGPLPDRDG